MQRLLFFFLTVTLIPALSGCVPVLITGAATSVGAAHDRRTLGAQLDDQTVELKVSAAIVGDKELSRKTVNVNVTSFNGLVLLTGETETTETRDAVLRHVRAINGVRRITNELRIEPPSSFGARSKDSLITSAVKSRLLVTKNINPTRFKVTTEAEVVYLMGLVTNAEGELGAEQAATIDGVTRVVKVFEYID